MNKTIYVLGHKNPDTDSICSAVAYAELKCRLGINAVAGRLGELNKETEFVLDYFDVEAPELVESVKKQVSDLDMDIVQSLSQNFPIKKAWSIMKKTGLKALPVVGEKDKLIGIVTLSDITERYMDAIDNNIIAESGTSLHNIADTLNATLVTGSQEIFRPTGRVLILSAEFSQLDSYIEKGDIIITGNRQDYISKSMEMGANCIILTCCSVVDDSIIEQAKKNNCILMTTPSDTFTIARLINQSIPVGYVMTAEGIITFEADDYVEDIKQVMMNSRFRSYPVVDNVRRIIGFISRYHVIGQNKKQVILVDHNEMSQTVDGIEEAEILEIIDHHRIGDIRTEKPILFKNDPVGCTSTIVANSYFDSGLAPSKKLSGLMCAAILSDTLKFKSPTCTYLDKITAEKLASIAGIDIDSFSMEMFRAGSALKGETPEELLTKDFKEYEFGKGKVGIAQITTIDIKNVDEIQDQILESMAKFCSRGNYGLVMLLVTDIMNQGSEVFFCGRLKDVVGKAFGLEPKGNSVYLPGIVSRKKQIVPAIANALE